MYLICDFDGTLVKNDYFVEQLSGALIHNPFKTLLNLASKSTLDLKHLYLDNFEASTLQTLLNKEVVELIQKEKSNFTKTILISASPDNFIKNNTEGLNLFDEVHGSQNVNLKSEKKLNFIKEMKLEPFVYIGDSKDDEILFKHAVFYYKIINQKPVLFKK